MNASSPFAVSAEEHFTVRELSMLLPPQFVRNDAVPGDQQVHLPLDMLRASLQQGRPALRLSQIYMACPFLFTRPVAPAEDMEIVLPFQKVKRMTEPGAVSGNPLMASPFMAAAPPPQGAPKMESPFASPFVQSGAASPASMASPFAVRTATAPVAAAPESPFPARGADPAARREILSPFNGGNPPQPEAAPPSAVNPFQRLEAPVASPQPRAPMASPFSLVTPAAPIEAPEPAAATSPVFAPSSPAPSESPFAFHPANEAAGRLPAAVRPEPVAPAFESAPESKAEPPAAPPPTDQVRSLKVPLAALLRDVTAQDLGFDPSAVPNTVEAELSFDTILPQLATGRVEVGIEELRQGVVERFRPALARVRSDVRFVVPLSAIFQTLPASAIPAPQPGEHVSITTTPFQTPFAIKAEEDESRIQLPELPPAAPVSPVSQLPPVAPFPVSLPRQATAPVPQVPAALPPLDGAAPPPSPAPAKLQGLPPLPQLPALPGATGRPSPFARPPGTQTGPVPVGEATPLPPVAPVLPPLMAPPATLPPLSPAESHDDLGHPFSAASLRAEPPAMLPAAPAEPFDPAKLFPNAPLVLAAAKPAPPAAPVPARPAASAASSGPPVEFNFGEALDLPRVTLRALFMTDEDLTPHEIVDRCAQLPGVGSCLAIAPAGVITSAHDSASEEVSHFAVNAPRAHEYLTGLAESMGLEGNGSFTLRSANAVRTFFIERGICLAVLHGKTAFAPGVRDKLVLTARLLADIVD